MILIVIRVNDRRIPNVVPAVDHVFRAGVDLVQDGGGGAMADASETYTLDDIDAALMAQVS